MLRSQLVNIHKATTDKTRKILEAKNADYSGSTDTPFANFEASVTYGVHPLIGLLVRVGDKLKRIESFVKNGKLEVVDETVEDAFEDVINYMVLGKAMVLNTIVKPLIDGGDTITDYDEFEILNGVIEDGRIQMINDEQKAEFFILAGVKKDKPPVKLFQVYNPQTAKTMLQQCQEAVAKKQKTDTKPSEKHYA